MNELSISVGDPVHVQGEQEIGGAFYTPEDGTLSITIMDMFGTEVSDLGTGLPYPFTIAGTEFVLPESELVKTYIVRVGFIFESLQYTTKFRVKCEQILPLNFTQRDILQRLNSPDSCLESDVDLHYAYSKVQEELGETFMTIPANYQSDSRLVYLKALLLYLPTFTLHVYQSKKIDDHSDTRFKVDTEKLYDQFSSEYNLLRSSVYSIEPEVDTLLSVVATTDVITGESNA